MLVEDWSYSEFDRLPHARAQVLFASDLKHFSHTPGA
jgi:hypothetical protein